jgi:hypothetical protein
VAWGERGRCEAAAREALECLDREDLFPAEQVRIVPLLVQRVDLRPDGLELRLRTQGLGHIVQELETFGDAVRRAA